MTKVNTRFLSPVVLASYSVLIFLVSLPFLPVEIKHPLSLNAILFWLLCFAGFQVGALVGAGGKFSMPLHENRFNPKRLRKIVLTIVWAGTLGVLFLIVDRYFIRGASLEADVFQNREILMESQASGLSAVAAFLSSIGLLSLITIWLSELNQVTISRAVKSIALLNVLTTVYLSIELGSRSLLLVVVLIHLFAWLFTLRARGLRLKVSHKIAAISAVAGLVALSAAMMVARVDLMGLSMLDSVLYSAYAFTIAPTNSIRESFQNNPEIGLILAGLFSLVQYVFHGIYEFSLLFNNFQGEHEMGARTLWLPIKTISVITNGLISVSSNIQDGERLGIFTTFVGPIFVDFGLFSPIALFVYGLLLGIPYRLLTYGRETWLPTVVLFAAGLVLWPVVNVFLSASGTYLLVAAVTISMSMQFGLRK